MQIGNSQPSYNPSEIFAGPPVLATNTDPGRLMATPTVQELQQPLVAEDKLLVDKLQPETGLHVDVTT